MQADRLRSAPRGGGDQVQADAEALAEHAARVADAAAAVDAVADRDRVHDLATLCVGLADFRLLEDPAQVGVVDLVAADGDIVGDKPRLRTAGGDVDDHLADVLAGHPLGGFDGGADRGLGGVEIDEGAGAQAAGGLMTDADDDDPVADHTGDEAAHLRRADVERGDEPVLRPAGWRRAPAPQGGGLDAFGGTVPDQAFFRRSSLIEVRVRYRADDDPVGQAEVDAAQTETDEAVAALIGRKPAPAAGEVCLRHPYVEAVAEAQVPAPAGNPNGCLDPRHQRRFGRKNGKQVGRFGRGGLVADDDRQLGEDA